jgi:hypothetical protein
MFGRYRDDSHHRPRKGSPCAKEGQNEIRHRLDNDQTFHQFLERADGRGGFAVVETDDLAGLALGHHKFSPWLEFALYPVLDYADAVGLLAEAAEFRKSIA